MNTKRSLIWVIVLLGVLNLATISTIIYHHYQEKRSSADNLIVNADGKMMTGRYMRDYLGFDNSQMEAFRNANHQFRPASALIISRIDSLKNEMFTELKKPDPDTLQLNILSNGIGNLHAELKQRTADFYLKIKSVCTSDQLPKLEELFAPLFRNEDIDPFPGQGRGRGMMRPGRGRFYNDTLHNSLNK